LVTAFSRAAARAASAPDPARPFLKWAGGKRQLLPQLRRFVPPHFEQYFERRLARFAPVFYGLDTNLVLSNYLDKMFARTTRFSPLMAEEYSRGNGATFDDRSTAFGVASVCYSHAITDNVNIYYFIWKAAGGSVRTPPRLTHAN